jgi:hypothetical protein
VSRKIFGYYFQTKFSGSVCGKLTVALAGYALPHLPPMQLQFTSMVLLVQEMEEYLTVQVPLIFFGR